METSKQLNTGQAGTTPPAQACDDPLARSKNMRSELESLRNLMSVMDSPLVDESVRSAFFENLARAELDVAETERQCKDEYDRRSAMVDATLKTSIGEKLLEATGLTWETFNLGRWEIFLQDNKQGLTKSLSSPASSLCEIENLLKIDPSHTALPEAEPALSSCQAGVTGNPRTRGTASSTVGDTDNEGDILIADGDFMSGETLRQCSEAGLETLGDASAFTASELSDLGLSQGAVIQLSSLLSAHGMSLKADDATNGGE